MATVTTGGVSTPARRAPQGRAGFAGTLHSEFTKIRSVRSTYWTLIVLFVVSVGLSAAITWGVASTWSHVPAVERATFDPTSTSLAGGFLGQFIIAVLGAIVITAEYSTGMIRTSLTAMPRRGALYLGKVGVLAAIALVIGLITSFCAFLVGQALLAPTHVSVTLATPKVLPAVVGSGLYIALCGLFAYGIGAILRHTAAAVAAAIGLLFVPPIIVLFLPASWHADVLRWLPSSAGNAISSTSNLAHMFPAWGEFAVFAAYTAAVLIAGAILFLKRDA